MYARSHIWNEDEGIPVGLGVFVESCVEVLEFGVIEADFLQL